LLILASDIELKIIWDNQMAHSLYLFTATTDLAELHWEFQVEQSSKTKVGLFAVQSGKLRDTWPWKC